MPLSDEQRSMLQLLLQGQSYDDIGSLLGVDGGEVRSRARAALEEMGGADPDARVGLSDFLLGQADPIGRADAVRQLQGDPEANALAERLVAQLRLLAPSAELPEIPAARARRRAPPAPPPPPPPPAPPPARAGRRPQPAPPPAPSAPAPGAPPEAPPARPSGDRESLGSRISGRLGGGPGDRSRALIALGAGALLIIAVVIAVVVSGGDDDGGGGSGDESAQTGTTPATDDLTIVQLAPVSGDSDATGQAVFAQVQDQPVLQLNLNGLEPAGEGNNYIVWLYSSDRVAFPVARDQVSKNGSLTGAAALPAEIVSLLGQFGCVDVSLASNEATQKALGEAVQGERLPAHSGRTVLRGQIPAGPGEAAPSGADSQCELAANAGAGAGAGEGTATTP